MSGASIWNPSGFLSAYRQFLRVPANEAVSELGDASARANKLLGFNSLGDVQLVPPAGAGTVGENVFTPYDFDSNAGTGSDDTSACQQALDAACAVNGTALFNGNFSVSALVARNGIRKIIQHGGKITLRNVVNAGIRLAGLTLGESSNVRDLEVYGLNIDANNNANDVVAIWGTNCSRVRIYNCQVTNLAKGYPILLRNYTSGGAEGGGNIVLGNFVSAASRNAASSVGDLFGITVDAEPVYGAYGNAPELWKQTFTGPTATQYNAGNLIASNRVIGGYYGFSLNGLVDSVLVGNNTQNNQRGFSLQNNANGNVISGCKVYENYSAGIHFAYGSSDNLVESCQVLTSVGKGEALLQAYVGCKRNDFVGNKLTSNEATQGNQYGIYFAIHADGNTAVRNVIRGRYFRASMAVESAWRTTLSSLQWHYGNGADPAFSDNYASQPTTGVVFENNTIWVDTATQCPAIYLGQVRTIVTSTSGYTSNYDAALTGVVLKSNTCIGTANNSLYLYENTAGSLNNIDASGNTWGVPDSILIPSSLASYINLPRGRAHFKISQNNWPIDLNNSAISVTGTTFSAAVGKYFGTTNSSSTLLATITGGMNGQEIRLRLDNNSGIAHSSSGTAGTIRLATGEDIGVGTANSDDWIHLRQQAGVWLEMNRSKPSGSGGGSSLSYVLIEAATVLSITPNASTPTLVTWPTPVADELNEFDEAAGTFTATHAGYYFIAAHLTSQAGVWHINTRWEARLYINGSSRMRGQCSFSANDETVPDNIYMNAMFTSLATGVKLAAGDVVTIRLFHNGTNTVSLNSSPRDNWLSIICLHHSS